MARVTMNFIDEGNRSVMIATGKSSKPSDACEARYPLTHRSVKVSLLKVNPISR